MNTIHLAHKNIKVRYEFRNDRALVVFANFSDIKINQFADHLESGCLQIKKTDHVLKYDSETSAIVLTMEIGYDAELAKAEIEEVFNYCFAPELCLTTAHT